MRKFLRSIGTSKAYIKVYQKARDRFCNLFISQIKDISALLDKDYIGAFNRFDLDKSNFELALNISLKSDYLLIPTEHHESIMICYLFEAMLNEKQRRAIFNSWAEKAEEDGKKGSILRAELKCREALQVLHLEGWQRALEVVKMAEESLDTVQKESKGQIGTAYEGKKEFHEAIEFYQEALELSKELKIPGMVNTALYNRNIANAYSWLREFEEAYQPAKNAYEIRKDILGKHPWTARSAFQMAEICRSLEDFDEAEEFYEEAWQIEKSLGQGNHSEVMVRIVQSYEANA
ncbi:hypothetical protein OS493_038283 [Desmophyllum pertusum]|uniref:Tetratricopeptide repeat protein n=1 Tax=Desmophyllum pertusum TaxID=174260 RepID=A0A9W9ZWP8_9CNID|nr:hypothetical protein OS493_038283 [Desmophyllum pertusum]